MQITDRHTERPTDRHPERPRRTAAAILALVSALALSGCSEDDLDVDLAEVRQQLEEGAEDVRRSAGDIRSRIEETDLDDQTRGAVDDAVAAAERAIEDAGTTLDGASDDVAADAEDAMDEAAAGLDDARQRVADAAAETDGAVREALDRLAQEIDRLIERVRDE